jgi:hypothetical protein
MIKIFTILITLLILTSTIYTEDCDAQWAQCDGIFGGSVCDFAIIGNNIYAGTSRGVNFYKLTTGEFSETKRISDSEVYRRQ